MFASKLSRLTLSAVLFAPAAALMPTQASAMPVGIGISVNFGPPALPVYVQPPLPAPGYIWTPGYWAYGDAGYYWVPGTWVMPPQAGYLWTPGYWGYEGAAYIWHGGYWGPHVGYYGGINYGFGYGGIGFVGGEWRGGGFFYNTAVVNVGAVHVTNVYVNRTVIQNNIVVNNNHVAYAGGPGGINHPASAQEQQWSHENHVQPTANQMQHRELAAQDRSQLASVNHGRPGTMATQNNAAYHTVAQQHMQAQPISAQDRNAGRSFRPSPTSAGPNGREANQDQRIANGLRSGQMTSGEAARADQRQSNIDQQVRNDRAANGGTLTNQERNQVNREQNRASQQIYNENHNGNTVRPNEVDNREANQQQRTANGLRSGQMTSGEAARSNYNQGRVDQQVHNERQSNGGDMNRGERQQVNREENHNSQQIRNENHNDHRR